jgi:hypothetical protein
MFDQIPSARILESLGEKFGASVIREGIFGEDFALP